MGCLILLVAIAAEVVATLALRMSVGSTGSVPAVVSVVGFGVVLLNVPRAAEVVA